MISLKLAILGKMTLTPSYFFCVIIGYVENLTHANLFRTY